MSTPMLLSSLSAFALLGLFFALSLYSRRRAVDLLDDTGSDSAAIDRESFADHYRPMTRILDARELESCRTLAGLSPSDFARFRSARLSAFNLYLREMRLDFHRIEFKLRYLMLAASHEEASLVISLNRIKSSFQLQLFCVQIQLLLFRFGWASVNVEPLVEMLNQLESSLIRRPIAV